MSRFIISRLALSVVLVSALGSGVAFAQSQDSVAEAARRSRAQKKNSEKPAKVVTDETLEVKKGEVQSAAAEQLRMPGAPETPAQPAPANTPSSAAQNEKKASEDEKLAKELAALKEQIKQAESDLDLAKREQALQQDTYFSNPDYVHDTAGKAKLDAIKQQITDKQQELDRLKARLAELQPAPATPPAAPPKP
jgi:DNA repair exonuclease SbcCD ATPase subunit